jgi:hypothetical protein
MLKQITFLIIGIAGVLLIFGAAETDKGMMAISNELGAIFLSISVLYYFVEYKEVFFSKINFEVFFKGCWNKDIRLSVSYLFQIEVKNSNDVTEYLLVKNKNTGGFQPVGGVYKYYHETPIKKLNARPASQFHKKDDFRLFVKGKHLGKFLAYFESGENRETSFEREFKEELIDTGILDARIFSSVQFEHLRQERKGISESEYFKCKELVIYDIVIPHFTQEQQKELENLMNHSELNKGFRLVSENLIREKGYSKSENKDLFKIQEHTYRIL